MKARHRVLRTSSQDIPPPVSASIIPVTIALITTALITADHGVIGEHHRLREDIIISSNPVS